MKKPSKTGRSCSGKASGKAQAPVAAPVATAQVEAAVAITEVRALVPLVSQRPPRRSRSPVVGVVTEADEFG